MLPPSVHFCLELTHLLDPQVGGYVDFAAHLIPFVAPKLWTGAPHAARRWCAQIRSDHQTLYCFTLPPTQTATDLRTGTVKRAPTVDPQQPAESMVESSERWADEQHMRAEIARQHTRAEIARLTQPKPVVPPSKLELSYLLPCPASQRPAAHPCQCIRLGPRVCHTRNVVARNAGTGRRPA